MIACEPAAIIGTPQLDIVPLDQPAMQALFDGRRAETETAIGASIPRGWSLEGESWLKLRIAQVEADRSWSPWLLRSIVRSSDRVLIGTIGFHGPPGTHVLESEWEGVVEFGYTIIEGFRGRGYATAAARALMEWGIRAGARRFVLSIAPDNRASRRVAEKLGFRFERQYEHEARGTENLFALVARPTGVGF